MTQNNKRTPSLSPRSPAHQVEILRQAARYLNLSPVIVGDAPLTVEMFSASGECIERLRWQ